VRTHATPPGLNSLAAYALTACLATLCVAGCSSSHKDATTSSTTSGANSSDSASSAPLAQNSLPPASSIVNNIDKRKAIVVSKCSAADGGWQAAGTANNTGTAAETFAITIFFTNSHATVEDYATTNVTVKAGQTANWTATKKFTATAPTNCVLRGVA
jgi:hypothetical protein